MASGFTVAQLADALNVTEESLQASLDYYGGDQYTFDTFISPFKGRELGQADAVALAASGYTPEQIASALKVDIDDLKDFLAFADTTTTGTTTTGTTTTETTTPTDLETFAQTFSFSGDSVTAEEAKTLLGTGFTVAELADALNVTEKSLQENLDYHTSGQYEFDTFIDPFRGRELGQADAVALANSGYTPEQIASALKVDINDLNDFLAFADTTPTDTTTTDTTTTETTGTTPTALETFAQTFSFSGDSVTAEEAKTLLGTGFTVAELADALDVTEKSLQENLDYHTSGQYEFDTFIDPFRGRELGQADAVALANSGYTPEQIASALKVDINDLNDFLAFADTTPTGTTTTDTTTTETTKLTPVQEFAQTFSFSGDSVTADEAETLINTGFTVAELADALDVTEESLQENLDYHTSGQYGLRNFVAGLPDKLDVNGSSKPYPQ
jgi:predicted flap endonuclease-1-like 5' DNA nuclease